MWEGEATSSVWCFHSLVSISGGGARPDRVIDGCEGCLYKRVVVVCVYDVCDVNTHARTHTYTERESESVHTCKSFSRND